MQRQTPVMKNMNKHTDTFLVLPLLLINRGHVRKVIQIHPTCSSLVHSDWR